MRALAVRHGSTDWNVEGRVIGQADPPLNKRGNDEASILEKYLQTEPITLIWTSDLVRAVETAEILAYNRSLRLERTADLREASFGQLEGSLMKDLTISGEWKQRASNKYAYRPPNGEDYFALEKRTKRFLDRLSKAWQPHDLYLIVTHVGVLRVLNRILNHLSTAEAGDLNPGHLAIWDIRFTSEITRMTLLRDLAAGSLPDPE